MGDCSNGERLPRCNSGAAPFDPRRFSKHIHDNVHGNIYLDRGQELGIESFDVQTVKLAGLLHDVGHGPFSHMFEREFLPRVRDGIKWSHEDMSLKMIDYIVDEHSIDIDSGTLKKVKVILRAVLVSSPTFGFPLSGIKSLLVSTQEMIVASEEGKSVSSKEKQFLYDIVANGRNGIDVDKLMETMRVIDNEICYRAKEYLTIHKLFSTRADLHRTVYTHPKVKAIELMVVDALIKANDHLQIDSLIDEPAQYWMLDDTIVKTIETSTHQDLEESRNLIRRIRRRDIYQFCNEFAVPKENLECFKNVTAQDIICSQNSDAQLNEEDVIVTNVKIDLTSGRNNPLERISFFQDYDSFEKSHIKDDRISHLLPACYQDLIVRVYTRDPKLVEAVSNAFENFQMKTYGEKTQVHATPEKKKRLKYKEK
ncbi:hypothetical protein MTR67_022098 [Solanum verrucosum]|uniref:Uncharacterized protein n=1 Tax=Solanum verrucosum TaxID=315347 RepID=A0AAF0QUN8_SOLVR|nr:hypothetical protein MTR67_022098 [Solanum verrucosum]